MYIFAPDFGEVCKNRRDCLAAEGHGADVHPPMFAGIGTEHKKNNKTDKIMKKFYKFFFVLLSLVVGGVGAPVSADAADYDLEMSITVMRRTDIYCYTLNDVELELSEVWKALGVKNIDDCTLYMLDVNDNKQEINIESYEKTGTEEYYDGWFDISGTPKNWNEIYYGSDNRGGSDNYTGVNIKLFQAFYPKNNPSGVFTVCHMQEWTPQDRDTYTGRWAIVAKENNRSVKVTVTVVFYTPSTGIGGSMTVPKDYAPALWESYGANNEIQMYMGGWKYQTGSQLATAYKHTTSEYKNNDESKEAIKDYWEPANVLSNYGDGSNGVYYQYYFENYREKTYGKGDNARSEFLEQGIAGKYKHTFPKRKDESNNDIPGIRGSEFGKGNPFTVPCFGAFLKFEPEQNGVVTLYIVQNGIIDLSAKNAGESGLSNNVKWRPTYIVDELGNQLTDKNGVTAELPTIRRDSQDETGSSEVKETGDDAGQKIYIGWDGSSGGLKIGDNGFKLSYNKDNNEDVINAFLGGVKDFRDGRTDDQWEKLTGYKKDLTTIVYDNPYWTTGGTVMRMMPPSASGDGWIAVNKTYVKYTFPVKAGKSYYVFNNDSQIGFCGYEFKIDNDNKVQDNSSLSILDDGRSSIIPGSYRAVTVTRSFKQGWNAICLPFSVRESEMRKAFGSDGNTEDYELVTFNGCALTKESEPGTTKDRSLTAHFFRHAYQDILAGYPYMIYIPQGAAALNGTITFSNITIEDNVEMATFRSSHDYMDNGKKTGTEIYCSRYTLAEEDDYEFRGTFVPTEVRAGSYAVYSNITAENQDASTGIRYVANETSMQGLRSYLYPAYLDKVGPVNAVARIIGTNFSEVFDDSNWDDATVINDLMEEMGFFDQRENVYSITGQIVRQNTTSLVGLPKGIYIVKGKKYFVK